MNATTAFPSIILFSLVSITGPTLLQTTAASGADGGSASGRAQETTTPATPRKGHPDGTPGGKQSAGKPKQTPMPPDPSQVVEERLRSGQIEKPIAQGEISDRLNQLYSGSNSAAGDAAAEHASR